jgi:hypothetical protein
MPDTLLLAAGETADSVRQDFDGGKHGYNHLLPALPRYKGTAPDKRAPGLQRALYNDGGGKEGHQVVAAEKGPRAVPARGRADGN